MQRAVDLAIHHAVELAIARGSRLASITLQGEGAPGVVAALARVTLRRLGASHVELVVEDGNGTVRLKSVELEARAEPLDHAEPKRSLGGA